MRKRSLGLLFGAMLILTCIGCGAKSMTAKAQEAVLNEANIIEEAVATAPVPETKYTFTDMTAVMYAQNTVNVRNLPSTDGNKLGRLSVNDEITVNGQCNETGWYRFDYNGSVAYVSNKYVGANRVEAQVAATSGHWYDGYQYYTWYDMGSYFFYLTPTQEEANQAACDCSQGRPFGEYLWQNELWTRYPGRAVSYFSTSSDGFGIAMACSNYEDENWLYRPKYLWETVPSSPRVRFVD
ncbi:MAG: SH3 domain-containing protein [Lachnospiraceae bacterium]|nr:SH3 domain-containing protein [Lachnospiraceae bacterium]